MKKTRPLYEPPIAWNVAGDGAVIYCPGVKVDPRDLRPAPPPAGDHPRR